MNKGAAVNLGSWKIWSVCRPCSK